jgi:hypothetical protein
VLKEEKLIKILSPHLSIQRSSKHSTFSSVQMFHNLQPPFPSQNPLQLQIQQLQTQLQQLHFLNQNVTIRCTLLEQEIVSLKSFRDKNKGLGSRIETLERRNTQLAKTLGELQRVMIIEMEEKRSSDQERSGSV